MRKWAVTQHRSQRFSTDKLQDANFIQEQFFTFETARHEVGHAKVASGYGWTVESKSVIRDGNTLGVTKVSPPAGLDELTLLKQNMAIIFGGKTGEHVCGNSDHSGCVSDMGKADAIADFLSVKYKLNKEGLLAEAESNAFRMLPGRDEIDSDAAVLTSAGYVSG